MNMMFMVNGIPARTLLLSITCLLTTAQSFAQQSAPAPQTDDVVRVRTDLVQTDVTVVDKKGNVVGGLKADQFELRVDARSQPLAFFEQVETGSAAEEKQLGTMRNDKTLTDTEPAPRAGTDRRRLVFFFVDDIHLAGDSLTRARSVLVNFVENKMTANDRVAILSTSGQIGFLQQLTDNKAVLHEAIKRLKYKLNPETIASQVSISEVDANMVANRGDRGLFSYLVEATMKEFQMQSAINAVNIVRNRVRQINAQSRLTEIETLSRLQSLIRSTAPLAGRKIFFFISDGFVMDIKRSSGRDVMQDLANDAARVGAVIYTLDPRANVFGAGADASRNDNPEFGSRTASRSLMENKIPQEPLETLADETGGRAYLNPNTLDEAVAQALHESSSYYLLAWRPDTEEQRVGKSRLQVIIKDRPDLRVRIRRHFFDFRSGQDLKTKKAEGLGPAADVPEHELRVALGSLYPRRELPVSLSAGYLNTPDKGTALSVSMQIDAQTLSFDRPAEKHEAVVDVLGVALDDRGKFSSFKQKLTVPQTGLNARDQRFVVWNQLLPLPPGLYQVRVAVRDVQSGRSGSAIEWIEVPSLETGKFIMSSLFLGMRPAEIATAENQATGPQPIRVNVDHHFARNSVLRFQTYVYNSSRAADMADVWIQAKVLRDGQQVIGLGPNRIPPEVSKDPQRLPYWAEISLGQLAPGWYTLQVSANDRVGGSIVTQSVRFSVE
jgi:VWFA-related protein